MKTQRSLLRYMRASPLFRMYGTNNSGGFRRGESCNSGRGAWQRPKVQMMKRNSLSAVVPRLNLRSQQTQLLTPMMRRSWATTTSALSRKLQPTVTTLKSPNVLKFATHSREVGRTSSRDVWMTRLREQILQQQQQQQRRFAFKVAVATSSMSPKRKAALSVAQQQAGLTQALLTTTPSRGAEAKRDRDDAGIDSDANSNSATQNISVGLTDATWRDELKSVLASDVFRGIDRFVRGEIASGKQVFPPLSQVFSAFNATPFSSVKVVLIGQDPYHDVNQAHGMCFSVLPGIRPPPSLVNMYKELATDIPGFVAPRHGYLKAWADQGVLLLNATLTVEAHKPNSHAQCGWQHFTDDVIKHLNDSTTGLVFLLWGGFAQKKGAKIDRSKHRVVECAHPSPLSAAKWFGCKTFSRCNAELQSLGKQPIDWTLPADTRI